MCGERCIIPAKQPNPSHLLVGRRCTKTKRCPVLGPKTGPYRPILPQNPLLHPWWIINPSHPRAVRADAEQEKLRHTDRRCRQGSKMTAQPQRHPAPWSRRRPLFDSAPPRVLGADLASLAIGLRPRSRDQHTMPRALSRGPKPNNATQAERTRKPLHAKTPSSSGETESHHAGS
jgi:hypothetical protein